MKKYSLSFPQLHKYSHDQPFVQLHNEQKELLELLEKNRKELDFPAVTSDVGQLLRFLSATIRPKNIFEFGSGYGHSAFWYFLDNPTIEHVYLTEKNPNLPAYFKALPWPESWKSKMEYFHGNAFERIESLNELDMILVDGVKATYLDFLKICETKIAPNGIVIIDNAYWRGSFLDPELSQKENSARAIKELHQYIQDSDFWLSTFIPYQDGVILLRPI